MATEGDPPRLLALCLAVALALTGPVVFYLPNLVDRPFDWKLEGHIIGLSIAVVGAVCVLVWLLFETSNESYLYWAMAALTGPAAFLLLAITRNGHVPRWVALTLLTISIMLMTATIFGLIRGFAWLFYDGKSARSFRRRRSGEVGSTPNPGGSTEPRRKLTWYEWASLIVATITTVATIVVTAESFVHTTPGG
jgi:hypothetical protein